MPVVIGYCNTVSLKVLKLGIEGVQVVVVYYKGMEHISEGHSAHLLK